MKNVSLPLVGIGKGQMKSAMNFVLRHLPQPPERGA